MYAEKVRGVEMLGEKKKNPDADRAPGRLTLLQLGVCCRLYGVLGLGRLKV